MKQGHLYWDSNPTNGLTYYQHQLSIVNVLIEASNKLFKISGGKDYPTDLICGFDALNRIEVLPQYRMKLENLNDLHRGDMGRWQVHLDLTESNVNIICVANSTNYIYVEIL